MAGVISIPDDLAKAIWNGRTPLEIEVRTMIKKVLQDMQPATEHWLIHAFGVHLTLTVELLPHPNFGLAPEPKTQP